ncbi:hypothetical protein D3C80_1980990 [compost metagenome]
MISPSSAAMRRYSPFSMTLAWVQVRPDRYHSTGRRSVIAWGGTNTAKVISHWVVCESWENTPCMPPNAVFWERIFIGKMSFD